jgi:hypothetical protein
VVRHGKIDLVAGVPERGIDVEMTADLDGHRAASDLDALALDDEPDAEAV